MIRYTWLTCLMALTVLSVSQSASAGWPFFSEDGLRRGTPEYYSARAGDPVGSRQKFMYGKVWPVSPRPAGPEQLPIHRYHAAHYWPYPYQCMDRQSVRTVIDLQAANGWEAGTTFYDYHFDPLTHELNSAGQEHLVWLATQVPERYRQAFVASAADPAKSTVRIMSVEQALSQINNGNQAIPVTPRNVDSLGRPSMEVQKILTSAAESAPKPVINYIGAGTSK